MILEFLNEMRLFHSEECFLALLMSDGPETYGLSLIDAIWVLIHLSSASAREASIRSVLLGQAAFISDDPTEGTFAALDKLQVPHEWIWAAKAQYANSVLHDPAKEVQFLLNAQRWDEAHDVLGCNGESATIFVTDIGHCRDE